ncbi:mitochondrial 54S ribosomal protein bL28m [Kockiozyma suomiensis]|uniref:mitochondrial 54S ribosomal protein bL28m n=1 Tax=Kockiozyma suomiensis TaxID=1337062 RepID=UPI0033441556
MLFSQLFNSVPTSLIRPILLLTRTPPLRRQFSSTPSISREHRLVVSRRVMQRPALKTNFWVKKHLATGRRIKYPPYPYGDATVFKRSNRGLFGGRFPQSGNIVTEKLENKIKRRWLPNIVVTSLYSDALKRSIRLHCATKVLKTIKKEGGLDNYLTKDKAARIKELGPRGWRLRYAVLLRKQRVHPSTL